MKFYLFVSNADPDFSYELFVWANEPKEVKSIVEKHFAEQLDGGEIDDPDAAVYEIPLAVLTPPAVPGSIAWDAFPRFLVRDL